jgi:hypothetical protein
MHEKKAIPLAAAVAVLAVLLGTVIQQSAVYGAPSSKTPSPRPTLKVKVSSHVCEEGDQVDVWFYITNPSTDMEDNDFMVIPGEPIHKVEVHSITLHCITPSGTMYECRFDAPSGSDQPPARWEDTIAYPMETSLVLCVALAQTGGVGTYKYTCTAKVTYEEETFYIQRTFRVQAQSPDTGPPDPEPL